MASAYFAIMSGGGEHYTLHISNGLASLGHDVTIICGKQILKKPEPLSNNLNINYVRQMYFLRNLKLKGVFGAGLVHYYQYALSCRRHLLSNSNFDVIHTHDPSSLLAAIPVKNKFGIPIIATFHGPPSDKDLRNAKKVDAVIAVSDDIRRIFEKNDVKNVHTVTGGVDLKYFRPMDKQKCKDLLGFQGSNVLFVGRLNPIKNVDRLINAFKKAILLEPELKLVIIGEGVLGESLRNKTKKLKLDRNVIFAGAVPHSELPLYYNAADLFILPSLFESFSLVALEAAACNVPIALTSNANAFIHQFGKDAFITFNPMDIDSIASSLIRALDINYISNKSRLSFKDIKDFDWGYKVRQIEEIYYEVLHD